jgi:hypothetical protein
MIHEWMPDSNIRNFGDALTELLSEVMPFASAEEMQSSIDKKYFLIGSVIDNNIIMDTILQGYTPVFINCGWRGQPLSKILTDQCEFIGCRGPITQKELNRVGVFVEVSMDSAYLLKNTITKKVSKNKKTLTFPHLLSIEGKESLTSVESKQDTIKRIKDISAADFVLGGAMHACIVAHMYGVPFSPYIANDFYVDTPTKWRDWLESIGIPQENLRFAMTEEEGRNWYKSNKHYLS